MTTMNRETWLNNLADLMKPRYVELGYPLPKFRVSIGFTSGGQGSRANAECWSDKCSADATFEVLIRPDQDDPVMVAALLVHELNHAAVGFKEGHTGKFALIMKAFGMTRPFTSTVPTDVFREWVKPLLEQVGPLPHARLNWAPRGVPKGLFIIGGKKGKAAPAPAPLEPGGDNSTGPKKQATRMIKVACPECGYTARTTQKWLDVGPPRCPQHDAMVIVKDEEAPAAEAA